MVKITQAVILAGGKGERLKPFTLTNPKPLVPIDHKPFIDYLIKCLKDNGIKKIVILTGYLENKIKKHLGNGSKYGIKINYSYTSLLNEEGKENESGLRIKNAQSLLDDYFLLLYCDNYWPLQLNQMTTYFKTHPSDALVTIYANEDNITKNNIFCDDQGYVTKYDKNRKAQNLNGTDIGFFIVNKRVLNLIPKTNCKFESDILPLLIQKRRLSGYVTHQPYYSIGDPNRVKLTRKYLSSKKVILLDRDGVINEKPLQADYVKFWQDFKLLPHSIEAIKKLNNKGYQIFIITNQPGIARKIMTVKDLEVIHKKMQQELKRYGAKIDGIYYCPHGWNDNCNCRKPKPGLLYQASKEHFFDLTKTILIGDDERDIEAAKTAGCKSFLVSDKKSLLQIVSTLT